MEPSAYRPLDIPKININLKKIQNVLLEVKIPKKYGKPTLLKTFLLLYFVFQGKLKNYFGIFPQKFPRIWGVSTVRRGSD